MIWIRAILLIISIGYIESISGDCADPLACLLEGIVIALPNICTPLSSGTEFCIEDLTCNGIQLASIPTAYTVPTSLELDVIGLGTACSANFKYGIIHGSMTAALTDVTLDTTTYVEKVGLYPQSVQFTNCDLESINVDLVFSNPLLDIFAPEIAGIIERLVYRKACVELTSILSVNVTQFIVKSLDPKLTAIVNSQPDALPKDYGSRYTDWNNSFVSQLHQIMRKVQVQAGSGSAAQFLSCMAGGHRPTIPLLTTSADAADAILLPAGNNYHFSSGKYAEKQQGIWSEMAREMIQQLLPSSSISSGSLSFTDEESKTETSKSAAAAGGAAPKLPFKPINIPLTANATLVLRSVELAGLDTLSDLQLLEPLGDESKVTLRTAATFANLGLNVSMCLVVKRSDADSTYSQGFMLQLALTDLELLLDLVVAVDDHLLQSLYLDQLSGAGCWAQAISELSIPDLSLKLGSISSLRLQQSDKGSAGQLEHDIAALINNFFLIATNPSGFGDLTLQLLTGLLQGPLRTSINSQIAASLSSTKKESPCLSHYPYDDEKEYIRWADSKIITVLDSLVDDFLGVDGLNQLMSCATNGTGAISISVANMLQISISGLNSFYGLDLFQPSATNPFNLRSFLAAGYCPSSPDNCNPLAITIATAPAMIHTLAMRSQSLAAAMKQFSLQVSMSNLRLDSEMHVQLDFNAFRDLQKAQLQTNGCKQSTVNNASIVNLTLAVSEAQLSLSSGGKNRDITSGLNDILQRLLQPAHLDNHNEAMAQSLSEASATCSNNGITPEVQSDDVLIAGSSSSGDDWKWELFILSVGCTLSLAGLLIAYSHWGSATRKKLTNCFTGSSSNNKNKKRRTANDYYDSDDDEDEEDEEEEYEYLISGKSAARSGKSGHSSSRSRRSRRQRLQQKKEEEEKAMLAASSMTKQSLWERWQCDQALIFQPAVPLWLRVSVPVAICGTIAIFADSNYTPDAVSVMATIVVQGVPHDAGSVFDFGLGNTVKDMWSAEVYPLAILIAFFSGAWPYIKLLSMLWSWVAPPAWLSIGSRETVLITLDALGKWSLVDFFVMVLMLCAFYFNLVVFPGALEVDVTVKPKWGFFSFLLATMISLGLGHCILACHRLIVEPKVLQLSDEEEKLALETISSHVYEVTLPLSNPSEDEDEEEEEDEDEEEVEAEEQPSAAIRDESSSNNPLVVSSAAEEGKESTVVLAPAPSSLSLSLAIHRRRNLSRERKAKREEQRLERQRAALIPKKMHVRATRLGQVVAVIVVLLEAFCLIAGTFLLTMGFEFKGLTGAMLKDQSKVDYSFVTVGDVLPVHSGIPNDFAIRWLQASYFLFGLAMPLSLLMALLVLLVVPLSLKRQRQLHVLAEVFNAWSTLDVYCAAIAASLLEIQQFAAFIVGDSCDGINKLLEKDAIDERLDGDDKCFDVIAYLKTDSWVLFLAAAGLLLIGVPLLAASHAAIKQRLEANNKRAMAGDLAASLSSMAGWEQQQQQQQQQQAQARSPSPAAINEIPSDLDTPLLIQRWNEERPPLPPSASNNLLSMPTTTQQSPSMRDSNSSKMKSAKKELDQAEQQARKPQRMRHLWIFSLRMMARLQLLEILPEDEQVSSQQVNQQVEIGQQSSDEEAGDALFLDAASTRTSSIEGVIATAPLPPITATA